MASATVPKLSLGATNKQTSAKKDKVNNQLQQQANVTKKETEEKQKQMCMMMYNT